MDISTAEIQTPPKEKLTSEATTPTECTISTLEIDVALRLKYGVSFTERHEYGIPGLILLAGNHSFPSPPPTFHKRAVAVGSKRVGNEEGDKAWVSFYENYLHREILSTIKREYPTLQILINLLRIGASHTFPLVLQMSLCLGEYLSMEFSDIETCAVKMASHIDSFLSSNWFGEKVHIEISAKPGQVPVDSKSQEKGALKYNPEFNTLKAPLPYSSIGFNENQGTLACYVRHKHGNSAREVFALTCCHVVNNDPSIPPYRYTSGKTELWMHSPTFDEIRATESQIGSPRHEGWFLKDDKENFNPWFGHVLATSGLHGRNSALPTSEASSDWALIELSPSVSVAASNRHVPSSLNFEPFESPSAGTIIDGITQEKARSYFSKGPVFKAMQNDPLPRPNSLVLKKKTRMTPECTWAEMSPIKCTIVRPAFGQISRSVTREWCVVGLGKEDKRRFCVQGDSGSVLLDEEFRPFGMLWGSDENFDLTYVSPLHLIFRDIEQKMGWEAGSVSLL